MSKASDLIEEYLSVGGLFNPEIMNQNQHDAVRDTLIIARDEIRGLEQRIKRLEEALSWRPIETASYDHTWVLGYDANDSETGMIIFDRAHSLDDDGRECHWTDGMREWSPTHWMPLPDEPKAKEAKP